MAIAELVLRCLEAHDALRQRRLGVEQLVEVLGLFGGGLVGGVLAVLVLGDGAEILRPKALRDGYTDWLRRILDKYGE